MQTTYDAGQKIKTIHMTNSGIVTVFHGSEDQAIEFSGKFADSYVCMHKRPGRNGSNWKEIYKSQRGNPRGSSFKPLRLN